MKLLFIGLFLCGCNTPSSELVEFCHDHCVKYSGVKQIHNEDDEYCVCRNGTSFYYFPQLIK